MKKSLVVVCLAVLVSLLSFALVSAADFDATSEIAVVSREDGSGTRGAFVELTGVEEKNAEGKKVDNTTEEAIIANSTNVVMTTVAENPYAIGYISLGSLNETVKAVQVDEVEANVENINEGEYKIARPFNVAYKGELSEVAADFLAFILSKDGQAVVEEAKYIAVSEEEYEATEGMTGKIVVGGSSSVTPVMEKLKEAYVALNPDVEIEIQLSDSTTGMLNAIEGIVDLGMASRELKESELEELEPVVIARDGIAVIVNVDNPVETITMEEIKGIFVGEILAWDELN